MNRNSWVVAGVVVFGAVLGAQGQLPAPAAQTTAPTPVQGQSRIIQRVLVKVNGEAFTQTDLERAQVSELRRTHPNVTNAQLKDPELLALLEEVTPDILISSVDGMLMTQHGHELGFHMTDEKFQSFVDSFKKENKLDDAQLKAALNEEGMTMEMWREQWESQVIRRDVLSEEIGQHMQLTEEERRQYYAAHPDQFKTPATVTLREISILVTTQTQNNRIIANKAAEDDAKARLTAIRERILKGEDFAKVAAEVSESGSKDKGGLIGEFKLDDIDVSLRQYIEKLNVGDMTEPLRTPRGYQIIKLDAKASPQLQPYDAVRDDIYKQMYDDRLNSEEDKLLVKMRGQALIVWFDDSLKKLYDKRLAATAGK